MVFDVGCLVLGAGAGEDAQLARRHGHRPRASQSVFCPDPQFAERRGVEVVERARPGDAKDRADLQVVLQVLPDGRQLVPHLYAVPGKDVPSPDAGQLQDFWRIDGAGSQHDLSLRECVAEASAVHEVHAGYPAAFHCQAGDLRPRQDAKVGAVPHGVEKGLA